ncbi:YdcF family protein [Lysinibacillus sphaericus]
MIDSSEADVMIILGAGLKGEIPSKTLVSRLEAGKAVLHSHKGLPVVVSGGQGEGEAIPEAEAMGRYLMEHGISEDRIVYEKTSTTTYENLRNSMDVLRQQGMEDPNVIIVTSDYHVVRAEMLARDLGIEADGLSGNSPFVVRVNYFIREYFAIGKMMMEKLLPI